MTIDKEGIRPFPFIRSIRFEAAVRDARDARNVRRLLRDGHDACLA